jgi:hypothetical protein
MTHATTEQAPPEPVQPGTSRPALPFAAVLGLMTALAIILVAEGRFRDVDIYWHVIAGDELAAGGSPSDLGAAWSFAPDPLPWVSTQWLGEWYFHLMYALSGWQAIATYRTLTAAAAMAVLAYTTLRDRPKILAGFPYAIGVVAVAAYSQERTQQFTYIGAAALGGVLVSGLGGRPLPRWWILVPVTILWANVHGGWILMPATLGLVAMGRWLDNGLRDPIGWSAARLAALTLAAGAVSPAGLTNITSVFRIASAAGVIQEWGPVTPTTDVGIATLLLWILVIIAWRGAEIVPRGEVLVTIVLFVFAWSAWRNIIVAIVIIVPVVARRLEISYPSFTQRVEPRWSSPAGIGLAMLGLPIGLAMIASQPHLPTEDYPFRLYQGLAALPSGQRVLNDYDLGGMVLRFGGDGTQVGIDGRTDRYGSEYIDAYTGMMALRGEWQSLLDTLAPTSAILAEDDALAHVLVTERSWTRADSENGYVLLVAPAP